METDLQARLRRRAETFNTGMAVNPESIGTLGYYSGHDAALDREAADRLDALYARIQELEGALREGKNLLWRLQSVIEVDIDRDVRNRIADFDAFVDELNGGDGK